MNWDNNRGLGWHGKRKLPTSAHNRVDWCGSVVVVAIGIPATTTTTTTTVTWMVAPSCGGAVMMMIVFVAHSPTCHSHPHARWLVNTNPPLSFANNTAEDLYRGGQKSPGPRLLRITSFANSLSPLHPCSPDAGCFCCCWRRAPPFFSSLPSFSLDATP